VGCGAPKIEVVQTVKRDSYMVQLYSFTFIVHITILEFRFVLLPFRVVVTKHACPAQVWMVRKV
jgi:hypothetical protein